MSNTAKALAWIARHPRRSSAVAFSAVGALIVAAIWRGGPSNEWRLVVMAAVTSALAGAAMGRRLIDTSRTPLYAGFMGASASLLSLLFFSEGLALFIMRGTKGISGVLSLMLLTPLFAVLAVGWVVAVV